MHVLVVGASVTLNDIVLSALPHTDIGSEAKVVQLHVRRSGIGTNHLMGFFVLDAPHPGARDFDAPHRGARDFDAPHPGARDFQ